MKKFGVLLAIASVILLIGSVNAYHFEYLGYPGNVYFSGADRGIVTCDGYSVPFTWHSDIGNLYTAYPDFPYSIYQGSVHFTYDPLTNSLSLPSYPGVQVLP